MLEANKCSSWWRFFFNANFLAGAIDGFGVAREWLLDKYKDIYNRIERRETRINWSFGKCGSSWASSSVSLSLWGGPARPTHDYLIACYYCFNIRTFRVASAYPDDLSIPT